MLAVYPASSQTYEVVYLRETTAINSSADTFTIPDADMPLLTDLCELVWLVHLRQTPEIKPKLERAAQSVALALKGRRH